MDAALNSDKCTGRGCTGVAIIFNLMPVVYMSKMQGSVETSTYRLEFATLKIGIEEILGVRSIL